VSHEVDLHLHSSHSDGVLAPEALVALLAASGVRLFALTDHDTVAGLAAAAAAAARHGLEAVPGIELSAGWQGGTVHVLGLGIDPQAPSIRAAVASRAALRRLRAEQIRERLDRAGAPGTAAAALLAGHPVPTRTHYARALVTLGAAASVQAAFDRWLGRGRPGYVATAWPAMADSVATIVAAAGVAVLAHPLRYTLSAGQRRALVAGFASAGGTALEVVVGGAAAQQREVAAGLALRAGLEGSAGSDCHDPALPWHRPGRLAKLPAAVVPVWRRWGPRPERAAEQ
jgi:predicted metal-dependent phosphoesterase TrpH